MPSNHPFVVSLLSKKTMVPLQAAAAISGERMFDMAKNQKHDAPTRTAKVVFNDLALPERDSDLWNDLPDYLKIRKGARQDVVRNARNTLWLKVAWFEKRQDAQFARLFSMPLPSSLSMQSSAKALRAFSKAALVSEGMIADIAIHESATGADGVPKRQAFALATTRSTKKGNFQKKNREWNEKAMLVEWRQKWFEALLPELLEESEQDPGKSVALQGWVDIARRYSAPAAQKSKEAEPYDPFGIDAPAEESRVIESIGGRPRL